MLSASASLPPGVLRAAAASTLAPLTFWWAGAKALNKEKDIPAQDGEDLGRISFPLQPSAVTGEVATQRVCHVRVVSASLFAWSLEVRKAPEEAAVDGDEASRWEISLEDAETSDGTSVTTAVWQCSDPVHVKDIAEPALERLSRLFVVVPLPQQLVDANSGVAELVLPRFALNDLRHAEIRMREPLIKAFFKHSYVIVSVDDETQQFVRQAQESFLDFQSGNTVEEKESLRVAGLRPTGHVGYGVRCKSKDHFTVRRSRLGAPHPWPKIPERFERTALELHRLLEEITLQCFDSICSSFGCDGAALLDRMGDGIGVTARERPQQGNSSAEKTFTIEEVAEHNAEGNCWVAIHGSVYDISRFSSEHPGGAAVLAKVAGRNAGDDFDAIGHTGDAYSRLDGFRIGTLVDQSNGSIRGNLDGRKDDYSCSPMDIFVYYNTDDVIDCTNCCEHQDYGHISGDIYMGVPGLEVIDESAHLPGLYMKDGFSLARPPQEVEWLSIEDHLEPFRDCVVFLGDSIQRIVGVLAATESFSTGSFVDLLPGAYKGTWHRVRKNTKTRVATVYKVRPDDDFDWRQLPAILSDVVGRPPDLRHLLAASKVPDGHGSEDTPPNSPGRYEAELQVLLGMGMDAGASRSALNAVAGNVEAALTLMLGEQRG
jgi:predicted heme/steroid binding protein